MESRGLRPRRSVDYTAKDVNTATPGWLKLTTHEPDSPALVRAKLDAEAGKENSKPPAGRKGKSLPEPQLAVDVKPDPKHGKKRPASLPGAAKEAPEPAAQAASAEKGGKAHSKKHAQLATRGRNAGLQVLPAEPHRDQQAGRLSDPTDQAQTKPAMRSRKSVPAHTAKRDADDADYAEPKPAAKKPRAGLRDANDAACAEEKPAAKKARASAPDAGAADARARPAAKKLRASTPDAAGAPEHAAQPVPGLPGVVHCGPAVAAQLLAKAKRHKKAGVGEVEFSMSTGGAASADRTGLPEAATALEQVLAADADAGGVAALRSAEQPQAAQAEAAAPSAPQLPDLSQAPARGSSGRALLPLPAAVPALAPALRSPIASQTLGAALRRLQEEYAALHEKYQAIKAQRMNELESMLSEQTKQAREHTAAAYQLAEHWKAEARRQAAFAQTSGAAAAVEERRQLGEENAALRGALAKAESDELARAGEAAELRRRLADALRAAETDPVPTADTCVQVSLPPPPPPSEAVRVQAGALTPGGVLPAAGPGAPRSALRPAKHLQEACAMCPEGAEVSELYHGPHSCSGPAANTGAASKSWRVHCCTSAKPLVPYTAGRSLLQPPGEGAEGGIVRELQFAAGAGPSASDQRGHLAACGAAEPGACAAVGEGVVVEESGGAGGEGEAMSLSDASNGRSLTHATRKALDMLAGLEAAPAAGGGFTFRHDATGLAFAICPAPRGALDDDSDAEGSMAEPELAFQPISLGTAVEALPAYLRSEIIFAEAQRPKLLARIMDALGSLALRRARDVARCEVDAQG